jgi:hypothetical protein
MTIDLIKIRAKINIGNSLIVETPFIQSFNVRKSRGQLSTFDASLKVEYNQISGSNVGGMVSISAGGNGTMKEIYSGILKKSTISPCWDDPGYVILNISGTDVLSKLEGKKYTRRCRASKSSWVTINSVEREGLRDGKFDYEHDVLKTTSADSMKNQEKTKAPVPVVAQNTYSSPAQLSCFIEVETISEDGEVTG